MTDCIVYHGTNTKDLELRTSSSGDFHKSDMWYTYNRDYAERIARKRAGEYHAKPIIISLEESLLGEYIDPVEDGKANIAHYVGLIPRAQYEIIKVAA